MSCTIAPAVLSVTGLLSGKGQTWTPYKINIPQPYRQKV